MAAPYPQIVLLGDSIIQMSAAVQDRFSFFAELQNQCLRRYDVVNRGLSGYNTSQTLDVLPKLFPDPTAAAGGPKLAYLIVLLGANDAALTRAVDNQHVDLEDYERNLQAILTHPHIQAHKPRILLVTPPPLDAIRLGQIERLQDKTTTTTTRNARVTAQYAEAARRAAASVPGVVTVDLWKALLDRAVARTPGFDAKSDVLLGDEAGGQSGYLDHLLTDGLHLSGEGYRVLYEEVWAHIKPSINAETSDDWVHPEWRAAPWVSK